MAPDLDAALPAALYERVIARRLDDEAVRWLLAGFETFDRAGGEVSLEKCLCLPTAAKRRRSERDVWLRAVAGFVGAGQPTLVAREVAGRLAVFMTRGPWREWRELRDPPAHATDLQRALFGAARASGGNPPQWRQVLRVLDGGVIKESGSDNRVR